MYIDESGIKHDIDKTHGWSKIGERIISKQSGQLRGRSSVIAALNTGPYDL